MLGQVGVRGSGEPETPHYRDTDGDGPDSGWIATRFFQIWVGLNVAIQFDTTTLHDRLGKRNPLTPAATTLSPPWPTAATRGPTPESPLCSVRRHQDVADQHVLRSTKSGLGSAEFGLRVANLSLGSTQCGQPLTGGHFRSIEYGYGSRKFGRGSTKHRSGPSGCGCCAEIQVEKPSSNTTLVGHEGGKACTPTFAVPNPQEAAP